MTPAVLLSLAWLASAPHLKEKPRTDHDLVGRWAVTRAESAGTDHTSANVGNEFVFRPDGTWTYWHRGKEERSPPWPRYSVELAAKPRTIDLSDPGHIDWQGIYRIDGDTLTLRFRSARLRRPEGFDSTDNEGRVYLLILTRVADR